jgi:hypothetical protein
MARLRTEETVRFMVGLGRLIPIKHHRDPERPTRLIGLNGGRVADTVMALVL